MVDWTRKSAGTLRAEQGQERAQGQGREGEGEGDQARELGRAQEINQVQIQVCALENNLRISGLLIDNSRCDKLLRDDLQYTDYYFKSMISLPNI